jgi:hypothetical protein
MCSSVGSVLVVELSKAIELSLELLNGGRRRLFGEPFLECLMESFDFALRLRVTRLSIFLDDSE